MARNHPGIYPRTTAKGAKRYDVMLEFTDHATGQRKQQMRTFTTLKEAQLARADNQAQRGRGQAIAPVAVTLADCAARWTAAHSGRIRAGTLATYTHTITNHLLADLGTTPTAKLTMARLEEHYDVLRGRGVKAGMVRNAHQRLVQILRWAALHGFAVDATALQTPTPRYAPREMTCWNDAAMARFLACAHESVYGPIWRVALLTGLRRGELMALRWADIDVDACTMRIARARSRLRGGIVEGPTKNGIVRTLRVQPSLVTVLKQHHTEQLRRRVATGGQWLEPDLVFTTPSGATIHPGSLARDLNRILARAGLAPIRIHDLRHTHASWLLRHGRGIAEVAARLGHKSQAETLRTYSHCVADDHIATAALLEQMFG